MVELLQCGSSERRGQKRLRRPSCDTWNQKGRKAPVNLLPSIWLKFGFEVQVGSVPTHYHHPTNTDTGIRWVSPRQAIPLYHCHQSRNSKRSTIQSTTINDREHGRLECVTLISRLTTIRVTTAQSDQSGQVCEKLCECVTLVRLQYGLKLLRCGIVPRMAIRMPSLRSQKPQCYINHVLRLRQTT